MFGIPARCLAGVIAAVMAATRPGTLTVPGAVPPGALRPVRGSAEPIRTAVLALLEAELAEVDRLLGVAARLLQQQQVAAVPEVIAAARASLTNIVRGCRWLRDLTAADAEYLSVVRVRIVRARPHAVAVSEHGAPQARSLGRLLATVTGFLRDIDVRVLEARSVGKAYRRNTISGILHPARRRSDLHRGAAIELRVDARATGIRIDEDEAGHEYWLVITPPDAIRGMVRMAGSGGPSSIVFALPVR